MKSLLLFAIVVYFFASTQASFLRVINAVPGTQVLDVYYNVPNSDEKIRLFQDLNSTDIPPYFYVSAPPGNGTVSLTFYFKEFANYSSEQATPDQLVNAPTYDASIRQGNSTYTLIVAASQSQNNTSGQNNTEGQDSGNMDMSGNSSDLSSQNNTSGQNNSQSNYEFLLLNDRAQGDQPPSGVQFIRLVNVAPGASAISLIGMGSQCPQEFNNQTSGNETQGQSGNQTQSDQGQSTNQTQSALVSELAYLQSSDYIQIPDGQMPEQLSVCYQGQMIPLMETLLMKHNAQLFSIILFAAPQSQGNQSQDSGDNGSGDEGMSGESSEGQNQGAFLAKLTDDDQPITIENVRIRIAHAASIFSQVDVLIDGALVFSNVVLGNVTQYSMTVRGLHNVTVIPASGSENQSISQNNTSGSQNSSSTSVSPIIAFFAWKQSYTIAIVPTSGSQNSSQGSSNSTSGSEANGGLNSTSNSTSENGQEMNSTGGVSQTSSQSMIPGFQGPYHQIFVDQLSENATKGQNLAYIQVINLASDIGSVDVSIGDFSISNIQFLNTSQYINISATGITNITITQSGSMGSPIATVSQNLQASTLYTLWITETQSGNPSIFVTLDRKVKFVCVMEDDTENNNQQGSQNM